MEQQTERFEAWGLLELFGRQRLAGQLSEQTIGGCHFIRVDVPAVGEVAGYTRLFTQGAIYGMTITTEAVARAMAQSLRAQPIQAYELPQLRDESGTGSGRRYSDPALDSEARDDLCF